MRFVISFRFQREFVSPLNQQATGRPMRLKCNTTRILLLAPPTPSARFQPSAGKNPGDGAKSLESESDSEPLSIGRLSFAERRTSGKKPTKKCRAKRLTRLAQFKPAVSSEQAHQCFLQRLCGLSVTRTDIGERGVDRAMAECLPN